jgi:hypothetical protein
MLVYFIITEQMHKITFYKFLGCNVLIESQCKREVKALLGRAIGQAVSRRLPTAAARVQTRVWSCGIL